MIKGLDKYLTSGPPDDGFDNYSEDVLGHYITDEFYYKNESWIESDQCNKWLNKLFDKGLSPEVSAEIIERAFNFCKL